MSELPEGIAPAEPAVPRDSASGIVLRPHPSGPGFEVLLGLRSRNSRFLPGQLGCPGGAIEPQDRPAEPGAFERCATREIAEETGIRVDPADWHVAGERTTPPMFPQRFRTRFFVAVVPADTELPALPPIPAEIEALRLARPGDVLAEWAEGRARIPPPVLPILRELARAGSVPPGETARRIAAANEREQRVPRIEFVPDVWMLPVRTATLPPATHTNVWMPGGRRFAIVDPGSSEEQEQRRLAEVVDRRCEEGHEPAAIVVTHHHQDHVSGVAALAERLGLPVLAHPATLDALRSAGRLPQNAGSPLEDGDEIDLESMVLRALHTPGHASGHLALFEPRTGLLIAGDLASGLSTILIDPEQGDMAAYLASLARVRDLGARTLLPGHGPPLPAAALERLIEHRHDRERRVLAGIGRVGAGLGEIARAAYADTPGIPPALAERQALAHLLALERGGRVRRRDVPGRAWSLA